MVQPNDAHARPERDDPVQIARWIAEHVPVVVGPLTTDGSPCWNNWQHAEVDPAAMQGYRPGLGVAVVTGHLFDVLDIDPRHDGPNSVQQMRELGLMPRVFGWDRTPQGGTHYYIAPLGRASRDGILPGVDYKGGTPVGNGRGLAFIAPTTRKGGTYEWSELPDLHALADGDTDGEVLGQHIDSLRQGEGWRGQDSPYFTGDPPNLDSREGRYLAAVLRNAAEELCNTAEGHRNSTLYLKALKLGSFVAGAGLDEEAVRQRLTDAVVAAGEDDHAKTRSTLRSGLNNGRKHPRAVPARTPAPRIRRVRAMPASMIEPLPVSWVWQDRVPRGEICMTPGRGGVGKSTFHAWMVANLTAGTLPGVYFGEPRVCIIAAREDSWERTIVPRLIAAGASMGLVYRVDVITEAGHESTLVLPSDLPGLESEIRRVGAVLLSVDPLISAVDGKYNSHADREVREALEPLKDLTERTGCAVLGNAHYGKAASRDGLTLMMGSAAFGNVPRAVLGFARDDSAEDGSRVISQVKNNLGREDLPSLKYTIEEVLIDTRLGPAPVGRLVMQGESDTHVRDLLGGQYDDEGERDELVELLQLILTNAGGEIAATEAKKQLRLNGATPSDTTLYRARKRAGIRARKSKFSGGWVWVYSAQDSTKVPKIPPLADTESWEPSMEPSGARTPPGAAASDAEANVACSVCGAVDGLQFYEQIHARRCSAHSPLRRNEDQPTVATAANPTSARMLRIPITRKRTN